MKTEQLLLPLPDERPPIKEACSRFVKHLDYPRWLSSVGIRGDTFVVFLRTERHPPLPKEWEGYRIETQFFGEFAPMGGPVEP